MVQLGYLCLFRHYFPLVYYAIPYLHSELKAKKKSCYLFMVVSQMISQRLSLLRVTMANWHTQAYRNYQAVGVYVCARTLYWEFVIATANPVSLRCVVFLTGWFCHICQVPAN